MAIVIVIDLVLIIIGATIASVFFSFAGLFLISALCGPWAGVLTASILTFLSIFIGGIEDFSNMFSFLILPLSGYFAGRMSQWGYFKFWWTSILAGLLTWILTVSPFFVINVFTTMIGTQGLNISGTSILIVPMTISALLVFFLVKSPLITGFPHADYLQVEKNMKNVQLENNTISIKENSPTATQKAIGLITIAIIIFSLIFVLWFAISLSNAVN